MWQAREVVLPSGRTCTMCTTINQFPLSSAATLLTASMDVHKGHTWAFKDFMMDSIAYWVEDVCMWGQDLSGWYWNLVTLQSKQHQSFFDAVANGTSFPCNSEREQCLSNGLKASVQSQLVVLLLITIKEKSGKNYCYFWKESFNAENSCRVSWRLESATFRLPYTSPRPYTSTRVCNRGKLNMYRSKKMLSEPKSR